MSPFLPTTMSKTINGIVAHDDPDFIQAHILKLKENLTNCHNELQVVYGQLNYLKSKVSDLEKQNLKLKIELSIHGIELKDEESIW